MGHRFDHFPTIDKLVVEVIGCCPLLSLTLDTVGPTHNLCYKFAKVSYSNVHVYTARPCITDSASHFRYWIYLSTWDFHDVPRFH